MAKADDLSCPPHPPQQIKDIWADDPGTLLRPAIEIILDKNRKRTGKWKITVTETWSEQIYYGGKIDVEKWWKD